jgi:hypothetical protein
LLQLRADTAAMFNCSIMTVIRWERAGRLKAIRPSGSPAGRVYHSVEQAQKLARGDTDD